MDLIDFFQRSVFFCLPQRTSMTSGSQKRALWPKPLDPQDFFLNHSGFYTPGSGRSSVPWRPLDWQGICTRRLSGDLSWDELARFQYLHFWQTALSNAAARNWQSTWEAIKSHRRGSRILIRGTQSPKAEVWPLCSNNDVSCLKCIVQLEQETLTCS